jgi:hypothetical protein
LNKLAPQIIAGVDRDNSKGGKKVLQMLAIKTVASASFGKKGI